MIFGYPPAPKMKYADLPAEHWQRLIEEAVTHGVAASFNDQLLTTEVCEAEARQDFRKRTHTDQDDALLVLRDCTEMASAVGGLKTTKPPVNKVEFMDMVVTSGDSWFIKTTKPSANVFDVVKMAARQARIDRNAMRVYPVIKKDVMARTRREHDLANAIERTQLPHEMTIHERIMPYRVKE